MCLAACGGDGGGANGDDSAGVSFTEASAADLAGIAASAIEIFPRLSAAYQGIVEAIDAQNGGGVGSSTKAVIDIGDIGLCSTGQSNLIWDDVDDDQVLSANDICTLELVDCDDEINGTVAFDFREVAYAKTVADIDLDVTLANASDGQAGSRSLQGRFRAEINGVPGPPELAIARYVVVDNSDPTLGLVAELDREAEFALGCFSLYFTTNLETGGYALAEPFAVFKVARAGVMSIEAFGMPPLDFANGQYPISGKIGFYAQSGATPCTALGIDEEGVDSNDSFCTLTATGGGDVALEGETIDGTPFTVDTTWDELP